MSKKPANNNLPSLQELQQLQRNLPKLPDSMDPQKKRLIYGLLAVFAVIVLIIGLVYASKNGVDGLLGSDKTTSATDDEETNVQTETLAEVKNPYKAVDPATAPRRLATLVISSVPPGMTLTATSAIPVTTFCAAT